MSLGTGLETRERKSLIEKVLGEVELHKEYDLRE